MGGKEGGRGDGCERALKGEGSGCEDQSLGLATPRLLTNGSVCRWAAQQRTLLSRCRCAPWLMCPARHFKGIRAHAIGTAEAVVLRDGVGRGEVDPNGSSTSMFPLSGRNSCAEVPKAICCWGVRQDSVARRKSL